MSFRASPGMEHERILGLRCEIGVKPRGLDPRVEVAAHLTKPNSGFTRPSDPRRIVERRMSGESL